MFALEAVHDWTDAPGEFVSWEPSAASATKAADAPVSEVPVSYQQAQHLRAYREHVARGTQMARLTIPAWNIQGRCDIRLMTHVINAYLRRHDTYRSRFEFVGDGDEVVRRTLRSPKDIKFVATNHGQTTAERWREHVLATPSPLQWDCFRFGVIQRADHFTFFMSVDHLHVDAMFMGLAFVEIHMMYAALAGGGAPIPLPEAGSYEDYCVRQRAFTSALTPDSPQVRGWFEFTDRNDGTLPQFPLSLGDPSVPCEGDLLTIDLMDEKQSDRFESACTDAGARFIGGIFAAVALAENELTGNPTYNVITPTSTRHTQAEMMTTGWFTGTVPVSVDIDPTSFAATVRAAQDAFDSGLPLAHVPFDRVLELGADHGVRKPDPGVPMISYMDATLAPLSPSVIGEWDTLNGKIYSEMGAAHQVGMWFNRFSNGTSVTLAFPNNPIARESVTRYVDAMKAVFVRVAAGRGELAATADLLEFGMA
ncbi:acyltransferase [Mycolicibacterium flavescens]|uniref:Acyltransferase n=1 Tax=Mycolicibacterium flavescens TaxID=1776 RepID=A0A1E3RFF8_MYCFV|nr:condensation domain-containing protein [Mycolicibacterium flavescens]MCV7282693.1 acyltransferase [Mycolicibacterium flavescens]ODQ88192.1 acyltransferase [Mycolicibacterium flavescens]